MSQENKGENTEEESLEVSIKHQEFCKEYLLCMNATRAYMKIYPDSADDSARAAASRLLANDNIKAYIESLRSRIEEVVGISKEMVVNEHKKISFNSYANLLDTWMTQKEFNELPQEVKDCIAGVETRTIQGETYTTHEVKIKIYDKQKSLSELSKLLAYYAPEKVEGKNVNVHHVHFADGELDKINKELEDGC